MKPCGGVKCAEARGSSAVFADDMRQSRNLPLRRWGKYFNKAGGFMKITIVGLGLIGGSLAKSLRGFKNAQLCGCDTNAQVLEKALADGVIDAASQAKDAVSGADLVLLCLYPTACVDFVRDNAAYFKPGAVISDTAGIKGYLTENIAAVLPEGVDFVGAHPMAGREKGGYNSSVKELFAGAAYLIVPGAARAESVRLIEEMAQYIGCRKSVICDSETHDAMIAYTSQLMHVVAAALCDSPYLRRSADFSAGSLRDCTRVALINAPMWSELFCENSDALCARIEEFEHSLDKIKTAVRTHDFDALCEILSAARENKLSYLAELE